jgi:hypothetical protein
MQTPTQTVGSTVNVRRFTPENVAWAYLKGPAASPCRTPGP